MKTQACDKLGIDIPILQAPMQGAVGPRLAAAVSNAGAMGMLAPWASDLDVVRREIRQTQALTDRPFAVNLNPEFPQNQRLEICLQEGVRVISFFWQLAPDLIDRAKAAGAVVLQTVATAEEAQDAVCSGADLVVAQGWEAGGHVMGTVATLPLVPAVVDAVAPVPVIAAGGIADGRGLAAVLSLGAAAAWIGTRFLAAEESIAHPEYVDRVLSARESATVYLENLFDIGWQDAPHRVLRNETVTAWEGAGRPATGERPNESEVVARSDLFGDVVRYQSDTPWQEMTGDVTAMSMYSGQSAGLVKRRQPAAEIVGEICQQAEDVLNALVQG
jgi:NAD(P)H-dependent flavin oxidoreductase YrpB (nitropropane dioxygenase family)